MSTSQQNALVAPIPHRGTHAARAFGYLIPSTRAILAWVLRCAERSTQRRTLAQMTDWQLRDIGISRAEADAEAGKWCWRA